MGCLEHPTSAGTNANQDYQYLSSRKSLQAVLIISGRLLILTVTVSFLIPLKLEISITLQKIIERLLPSCTTKFQAVEAADPGQLPVAAVV